MHPFRVKVLGGPPSAVPVLECALSVLHVQVHPDVRIGPLELGHGALQRDGLIRIEFRREGVVRGHRLSGRDHEADDNQNVYRFHM